MKRDLTVIDNCDGCCSCCMEQGSPPGYAAVLLNPDAWPIDTGDHARVAELPLSAKNDLDQYLLGLDRRSHPEGPCCWLDTKSRRCRYYEHRPQICREFEVGSFECREWRLSYPPESRGER